MRRNQHNMTITKMPALILALTAGTFSALAEDAVVIETEVVVVELAQEPARVIEKQDADAEDKEKATTADKTAKAEPADEKKTAEGSDESAEKAEGKKLTEAELRQKMQDLQLELQNTKMQFQQKADQQRQKVQEQARKALDDIKLPENPTREQCEAFVAELRKACEGRRSFSSSDPATIKLKQIPADHFDLLITEIANRTSLRYYANYALREIEPEKLRERFVGTIEENPNNIGIIVMHGWVEDVRPQIINYINEADGSITRAWFQAAVELGDPTLYPKLHELTTQSNYASQFINMLEMLPDYDLGHTIDVCWRRAKEGKLSVSPTAFAAKAAEYGNVDALGALIETLRTHSTSYLGHSSMYSTHRTNVLKFIDHRGSNQDIQKWFKANKDKLVFDDLRKRYVIPEDF